MTIEGISPAHPEARALIGELDAEIAVINPGSPINGIDAAEFERAGGYFVVAREAGAAVGCGAFRPLDGGCAEIKRMFVRPASRKRGVARAILRHLEGEVWRRGFGSIVLETGHRHAAAIALYGSEGYFPIPPYLGYVGSPISRCFAKGRHPPFAPERGGGGGHPAGAGAALAWRFAGDADLDLLAEWNHQLIRDEGHRNPMSVPELAGRMRGWLAGEYRAVLFLDPDPVAYALFRTEDTLVHLRQLFVRRDRRRTGVGRSAIALLRRDVWPGSHRLTVDVLAGNHAAVAFWRSLGYRDYSITMEIPPK